MPTPPGLSLFSRRRALVTIVGGAAAVAGCSVLDPGPAVPAVAADPLEGLIQEKQALIGQYTATATVHGDVRPTLDKLAAAHRAHRDALLELVDARRRKVLAGGTPPVPGTPSATAGADRTAALTALRAAEKTASARSRSAFLALGDDADARRLTVLGCVTAAEASHDVVYDGLLGVVDG